MEEGKGRVCVTGGAGFIGSWIIKRLLEDGYSVNTTVRSTPDVVFDESSWSDVDYLRAEKPIGWPYAVSKTLTEKAVLEFGEENELEVVTLVPPLVFGPFICPKLPGSVNNSLSIAFGEESTLGFILQTPMVHVDDLARAHIFLLEHSNPKGRYNCSSCLVTAESMWKIVAAKYPEFRLPTADWFKQIEGKKIPDLSSKKLIDAGFVFRYGLEEMADGAIRCCKEKGYL